MKPTYTIEQIMVAMTKVEKVIAKMGAENLSVDKQLDFFSTNATMFVGIKALLVEELSKDRVETERKE